MAVRFFTATEKDEVCQRIEDIYQKCAKIDALFEEIIQDVEILTYDVTDDNGKEIAEKATEIFKETYENFYWRIMETPISTNDEDPECLMTALGFIEHNGKETLVIPNMRRTFQVWTENEGTEEEFQEFFDEFKKNYKLSEKFK